MKITFHGNEVNLSDNLPSVGQALIDFTLVSESLIDKKLSDFNGKRKILNIFPSIDTPVCAASVRKFNDSASKINNTVVLCISADLPFAAKRFCAAEGINNVEILSTFRNHEFLDSIGVLMIDGPAYGLAARAVIVLDETNNVMYTELVSEVTNEPDYDAALKILN